MFNRAALVSFRISPTIFLLVAPSLGLWKVPQSSIDSSVPKVGTYQELNRFIKQRYDGQTFAVNIAGLIAGEYQKRDFNIGQGNAGLMYFHFHPDMDIPKVVAVPESIIGKKTTSLNQIDERTFSDLSGGLNVTKLEKGEPLRVNKFYMRRNYVDLFLEPLDPAHMKDLDVNKASRRTTQYESQRGNTRAETSVAGFGLRFLFYFDKDLLNSGNAEAVVRKSTNIFSRKEKL
jgi:hypothetical protein